MPRDLGIHPTTSKIQVYARRSVPEALQQQAQRQFRPLCSTRNSGRSDPRDGHPVNAAQKPASTSYSPAGMSRHN
jgi:hypothetical protein